jgi:hypothetical protein
LFPTFNKVEFQRRYRFSPSSLILSSGVSSGKFSILNV